MTGLEPSVHGQVHLTNDLAAQASAARTQEAPRFLTVRVPQGATLAALARPIYGELTPAILDQIKRANVRIVDVNHILAGDTLRFPVADAPAGRSTAPNHE
jgi:phage tail protein X